MTIAELHRLTDWRRTLQIKSVWATLADGRDCRIVSVGRAKVSICTRGRVTKIDPRTITEIRGV